MSRIPHILVFSVVSVVLVFGAAALAADSGARVEVTPRHTEVYVDGRRAGVADDFDGFTQRLRVPPGEHVIELYLDGYKPVRQAILFTPGNTFRIRHDMQPLAPGEPQPPRPAPQGSPAGGFDAFGRPASPQAPRAPQAPQARQAPQAPQAPSILSIRVQPADAAIFVDGERWLGSNSDRLELQVTPGAHRIEVRKDGYQPFATGVTTRAGDTSSLNISLTRSQENRR